MQNNNNTFEYRVHVMRDAQCTITVRVNIEFLHSKLLGITDDDCVISNRKLNSVNGKFIDVQTI